MEIFRETIQMGIQGTSSIGFKSCEKSAMTSLVFALHSFTFIKGGDPQLQNGCYGWLLTIVSWIPLYPGFSFLAMFVLLEIAFSFGSHDHI